MREGGGKWEKSKSSLGSLASACWQRGKRVRKDRRVDAEARWGECGESIWSVFGHEDRGVDRGQRQGMLLGSVKGNEVKANKGGAVKEGTVLAISESLTKEAWGMWEPGTKRERKRTHVTQGVEVSLWILVLWISL
jgi:hypothetical protein